MRNTSKILTEVALFALGLLIIPSAVQAQTINENIEIVMPVWIECANGGEGELVIFEGTLHHLLSIQQDANGCYHVTEMYNPQGLMGTGQTTNDVYRATGMTNWGYQDRTTCPEGCTLTETSVNNFRLIGPGPNNNFIEHWVMKTTYNACTNESETIVDQTESDCR